MILFKKLLLLLFQQSSKALLRFRKRKMKCTASVIVQGTKRFVVDHEISFRGIFFVSEPQVSLDCS